MTKVIDAIFDGEFFRPVGKSDLAPNTTFQVHFDIPPAVSTAIDDRPPKDLWEWFDKYAGTSEGPEDWSEEHYHHPGVQARLRLLMDWLRSLRGEQFR